MTCTVLYTVQYSRPDGTFPLLLREGRCHLVSSELAGGMELNNNIFDQDAKVQERTAPMHLPGSVTCDW